MSNDPSKNEAGNNDAAEEVEVEVDPNAVHMTLDGREIVARKGELLIDAAERNGVYIPRFCYHPRMNPVGMCRMCLVEADTGRGPAITVSCITPVSENMTVTTDSELVKGMQEGVLEMLLINHPLDCPVCDKGGECPLQDQAMSHGPGESRLVEEKRHFKKPIPVNSLVLLDRERCILCDRCTRFANEVAGDPLIHFNARGNFTHITTFPDEPFSSYFSGNTVQICPVGALTAKPYRFKARPWDLTTSESTCTGCSIGCRIVVHSSDDQVVRTMGVDSDPVNWSWLCDRGRFNFEAGNSPDRLLTPLVRTDDGFVPVTWNDGIGAAASLIRDALAAGGPRSIAVLGGARGTNEDAFAWARLAHDVIGTPNVSAQLDDALPVGVLTMPRATIDETAAAKTIILLGSDLKEELPVLYLRLRHAAEQRTSRIIEFTPRPGGMTRYAWRSFTYEPGTQAAAVREALADEAIARQIASGDVVIVTGRANLAESSGPTIAALDALRSALPEAKVLPAYRRGNVVGAIQLGMRPGRDGMDSRAALTAAANGQIECLVLVGSDPLADFPDRDLARRALAGARRIIALDMFETPSSTLADVLLPAAAAHEKSGTTTNLEGRVTIVSERVTPKGVARPDWMVAADLAMALGTDLGFTTAEEVLASINESNDLYAAVTAEALEATPDAIVAAMPSFDPVNPPVVEISERNAYDYRLIVSRKLYDAAVSTAKSPSLAPLAPGERVHVHPLDAERVGVAAGAEVKVSSARSSVLMTVEFDDTLRRGTVWVPFNQPGGNVGELIDANTTVTDVRLEVLR